MSEDTTPHACPECGELLLPAGAEVGQLGPDHGEATMTYECSNCDYKGTGEPR